MNQRNEFANVSNMSNRLFLKIFLKHLKTSGDGGTVPSLNTKAHAKYERNLKRENIQENHFPLTIIVLKKSTLSEA